jgi:hypothetical protein
MIYDTNFLQYSLRYVLPVLKKSRVDLSTKVFEGDIVANNGLALLASRRLLSTVFMVPGTVGIKGTTSLAAAACSSLVSLKD